MIDSFTVLLKYQLINSYKINISLCFQLLVFNFLFLIYNIYFFSLFFFSPNPTLFKKKNKAFYKYLNIILFDNLQIQ